jgi:hypothetical protein
MLELQVEESEESGAIAIEPEKTAKTGADKKKPTFETCFSSTYTLILTIPCYLSSSF